jgi:hypothetical protein
MQMDDLVSHSSAKSNLDLMNQDLTLWQLAGEHPAHSGAESPHLMVSDGQLAASCPNAPNLSLPSPIVFDTTPAL